MTRLLLYRSGPTAGPDSAGDYLDWFGRVLGDDVELRPHAALIEPRPPLRGHDGIILTGSPRSLVEPEPWMHEARAFVLDAVRLGVPLLGVCFGHQLLGWALGGRVRVNPTGWEAGTLAVKLTDEGRGDPLFAGLPEKLHVNQSHRDELDTIGPGVRRLAYSPRSTIQAIAFADHVRGVQFHPEMNGAAIRHLISQRRDVLRADAEAHAMPQNHPDRLLARAADTPLAERVLMNFVDHFAGHRR